MGEDASTKRSLLFAELYRHRADWQFRSLGQGCNTGLVDVLKDFGLDA